MSQRFDIGVHYFLKGEYERAARAFQDVLLDEPLNGRAWSYRGIALAHLGHGAEAEQALSRAIELGPQNGEAWFHLGIARSLRSEWPEAVSAYRHAVAYLPDDLVAWHRLGVALAESGDEISATAAFERALVLSRETGSAPLEEPAPGPRADAHLGEVGEREGIREAQSWLDLALSLLSLGEEEEALAAYDRAFTLDPGRARRSLFQPMLRLLTAAAGEPLEDEAATEDGPVGPMPPRRPAPGTFSGDRPEVA
ncbi:MAG: tetratricopeptide repeat protein [Thermoplasmata archaeon]|nr:tetratricopeptide repeat protein [Thermoplasmata archaeon]MCI4353812.1 tetratricopeptide repeat protein [Thermoplasmata archaeon]